MRSISSTVAWLRRRVGEAQL
uniref:Uncharacterized protein n=1 Tax=Arundo donax TaxID=35708 RepID=A0A0A9AIG2_ARUDO